MKDAVRIRRQGGGVDYLAEYADESNPERPPEGLYVPLVTPPARPTIVCLCGSTRFYEAFREANHRETMAGRIVLSVGFHPNSSSQAHGEGVGCDDEQKKALDRLHLRKIDLADEVLILNVPYPTCPKCGLIREQSSHATCMIDRFELRPYIGASTARELAYARQTGKVVRFLNDPNFSTEDSWRSRPSRTP